MQCGNIVTNFCNTFWLQEKKKKKKFLLGRLSTWYRCYGNANDGVGFRHCGTALSSPMVDWPQYTEKPLNTLYSKKAILSVIGMTDERSLVLTKLHNVSPHLKADKVN